MAHNTPSRSTPLILAGHRHTVQRAQLTIGRPTRWPRSQSDDVGLGFCLELQVDEHSGEDDAPAPMIQSIPVWEAFGRWPRLDELPGLVVAVEDDALWDAWYGNDAPPLEANRLEFGSWSGTAIDVRWSARWNRGRGEPGVLAFAGAVTLARINLHLFEDEPIAALLTRIWGADALTHFEVTQLPRTPVRGTPVVRPRGMPETVSYDVWPRFLGTRADCRTPHPG
jgi:hypothetical protein